MIAIIDYGVGNLFSLSSSLRYLGLETAVTGDAEVLRRADRIILPGVGAFADAIAKLRSTGLVDTICEQAAAGKPLLGICLGMQLLFEKSYEYGEHEGLGLVPGQVVPLADKLPAGLKVPHIGWNRLQILKKEDPLFKYSGDEEYVYYVPQLLCDRLRGEHPRGQRVRHPGHRGGPCRQRDRHPVPPGEERTGRAAAAAGFQRAVRGES